LPRSSRPPGANPSTGPESTFQPKFDDFRAIADTVNGEAAPELIQGERIRRFRQPY
jgi:hypothetical protein